MKSPDFELIQRHFGTPISASLSLLYSDLEEVLRHDIEKVVPAAREDESIYIAWYEPLDEQSLHHRWPSHLEFYQFADDGSGSRYAVDPTDEEGESYYLEHEFGDLRPTGAKIAEFLGLDERD